MRVRERRESVCPVCTSMGCVCVCVCGWCCLGRRWKAGPDFLLSKEQVKTVLGCVKWTVDRCGTANPKGQVRKTRYLLSFENMNGPRKKYLAVTKKKLHVRSGFKRGLQWVGLGGPVIKEADGQRRGNASLVRAIFR